MKKNRAIPFGYMTIGEVAKMMGVTVRTLQYYDEKGLLLPSSESEGGRRLYTDKDVVRLHQILSLKHLGFSLNDIKNRLISLDTPSDVAEALTQQEAVIRGKIKALSESLEEIETLRSEVLQMQSVDFKKYADIIVNLQMKNEFYWMIKHMDDQTLDRFRSRFDKDSGLAMLATFKHLLEEALRLQTDGAAPESEEGQNFARAYWQMIMDFTGGDISMVTKLIETIHIDDPSNEWKQNLKSATSFIESALESYFTALGYNPMEEGTK